MYTPTPPKDRSFKTWLRNGKSFEMKKAETKKKSLPFVWKAILVLIAILLVGLVILL